MDTSQEKTAETTEKPKRPFPIVPTTKFWLQADSHPLLRPSN